MSKLEQREMIHQNKIQRTAHRLLWNAVRVPPTEYIVGTVTAWEMVCLCTKVLGETLRVCPECGYDPGCNTDCPSCLAWAKVNVGEQA